MADTDRPIAGDLAPLQGAWVLVAGPDATTGARLRARLAECGVSAVELAVDADEAEMRTADARPDGVLALPGLGETIRRRLDPLGIGFPPVIAMDELAGLPAGAAGDAVVLDRLASRIERARLRDRV